MKKNTLQSIKPHMINSRTNYGWNGLLSSESILNSNADSNHRKEPNKL